MGQRTVLYDSHVAAGARMVDFGGWDMPLNYGSQIEEHHAVRRGVGLFDVSHMTVVDVDGADAGGFLSALLANDIAKLRVPGMALYTCMLDHDGGVVDDLIVYALPGERFRLIVNAATREADLSWMSACTAGYRVYLRERTELAMIAVQGPRARALVAGCLGNTAIDQDLKPFHAMTAGDVFVARTGYTGEDGVELLLDASDAPRMWSELSTAGAAPCGLGARDTLRLEAGLNLYGSDMDRTTTPLESNLAWTVAIADSERDFIGRSALEAQIAAGVPRQLTGLVLRDKGVLRGHQVVHTDAGSGEITSGGFSPTLGVSIALARLPAGCGPRVDVEIRNRKLAAEIVKPPFVRKGQATFDLQQP